MTKKMTFHYMEKLTYHEKNREEQEPETPLPDTTP